MLLIEDPLELAVGIDELVVLAWVAEGLGAGIVGLVLV